MNYKICRIETLEELIEEHRNISQKVSVYEFDETSYTLLLIEINKVLKENQQLKESLQTHEILLRANVEENQRLKEQLEKESNTMENLKVLIKKVEKMRKACYSYEQYREYWKKVLEILDNKGE